MLATLCLCSENSDFFVPKDSPGQIAKLQLNTMGYSGQASVSPVFVNNISHATITQPVGDNGTIMASIIIHVRGI